MRPGSTDLEPGTSVSGWPAAPPARRRRLTIALPLARWRRPMLIALGLLVLLCAALVGTGYDYGRLPAPRTGDPPGSGKIGADLSRLRSENGKIERALDAQVPAGPYIIINQTHNRLYLKRGKELVHEAVCSAGSGMVLNEPTGRQRTWVFDTPRGRFKVLNKVENPVWKKPDWAFVEEGKPLPKRDDERIEYGMLGEYAMHFGNGYMIHGTLYERMLGRSVTHGCIRLGREDLKTVYNGTPPGTPIYIF
jgi:L,D-transpeptidase ErfK/SrfK